MRRLSRTSQSGFVLLPLLVVLSLLAAVGYLINRETGMQLSAATLTNQREELRLATDAGFQHALWKTKAANCSGYTNLASTPFGKASYSATVSPNAGSPVTITATGTLGAGQSYTLTRSGVTVNQKDNSVLTLTKGASGGDTMIEGELNVNVNTGGNTTLVGSNRSSKHQYILLRFDQSSLPSQATVSSALMQLNLEGITGNAAGSATVYRMTRAWSESQATWNRATSTVNWTTPGGDYDPTPVASQIINGLELGIKQWDITSAVNGWRAGTYPNHGLILIVSDPLQSVKFTSSESGSATYSPKVKIISNCPCGLNCGLSAAPKSYRDEFSTRSCSDAVDYRGSKGTLDWSTQQWAEVGDGGSAGSTACTGQVKIAETDTGNFVLRVSGNAIGIQRQANLSGFAEATLSFDYRRINWDSSGDAFNVFVSPNGGASWVNVGKLGGPGTDPVPRSAKYNISSLLASNTLVRFVAANLSSTKFMEIDNVQIDQFITTAPKNERLVLPPLADTQLYQNDAWQNYGGSDLITVGSDNNPKYYRGLFRFETPALPAGATVDSATLRLYVGDAFGGGSADIGVYRITQTWDEGGASWNKATSTTNWTSGGGQFNPAQLALTTVPIVSGEALWVLPTGLINEWQDGVYPNYGLLLKYEGSSKNKRPSFASREHALTDWQPQLVIEYTLP